VLKDCVFREVAQTLENLLDFLKIVRDLCRADKTLWMPESQGSEKGVGKIFSDPKKSSYEIN
jgi:hypothetical protein